MIADDQEARPQAGPLDPWLKALVCVVVVVVAVLIVPAVRMFTRSPPNVRELRVDGRFVDCYHVASNDAQQVHALAGGHPAPVIFTFPPSTSPALTVQGVRVPITILWVGPSGAVVGAEQASPATDTIHAPAAPVAFALGFPTGMKWPLSGESTASWWAPRTPLVTVGPRCVPQPPFPPA